MSRELFVLENIIKTTIRIATFDLNDNPVGTGTGFFFNFLIDGNKYIPAIVTNKHVVSGAYSGKVKINILNEQRTHLTGQAQEYFIPEFERGCILHPQDEIDLCIFPVSPMMNSEPQILNISFDNGNIPSLSDLGMLDAIEDIIMVGYPNGLWDEHNNLPITRKGITATHPAFYYNNRDEFLIDCACFPGSSGSLVLLYNFQRTTVSDLIRQQTRIYLLGILYAGPQNRIRGQINNTDIQFSAQIPNNLGCVIRAEKLLDFIPILKQLNESES